ncbi:hypothetical protein [Nocardia sp. NPDC057030]|uniref:hypothetical protein n=1 Tax=unclassified Nocardia TaxID=2637762 RepID=UPI003628E074
MTGFGQTARCGAGADGGGETTERGTFRLWVAEQRREWSDEVAVMDGYQPGAVELTTELLLSHKHPDDRTQVAAALEGASRLGSRSVAADRAPAQHASIKPIYVAVSSPVQYWFWHAR